MSPPLTEAASWVGIVANRNSGIGRGRQQVAKLAARALAGWPQRRDRVDDRGSDDPRATAERRPGRAGAWSPSAATARSRPCSTNAPACRCRFSRRVLKTWWPSSSACAATRLPWPEPSPNGHPRRVDVGSAGGRRFLLMVGFGFDGDVVTRHHQRAAVALGPDPADHPPGLRPARCCARAFLTRFPRSRCGSRTKAFRKS